MKRAALAFLCACRPLAAPPQQPERPAAELLYFVLVDRFADASPDAPGTTAPTDPHGWHGGDLEGVRQHLDHLQAMGVTTLWLSPIFRSRQQPIGEWGAFHGYWVEDLAQLEPRFGTEADLSRLSTDLHARGMRLVLDMVWNHTAPGSELTRQHPDWFHHQGDIVDWSDPIERVNGDVHGLPDLAQEKPEVWEYLFNTTRAWVADGRVDGLRIDAVRHMPLPEQARLNDALDRATGGLWTLGEDFDGDPLALAHTLREGKFDAVFDFGLRYALLDSLCKGHGPGRLAATLSLDRLHADPQRLVTFLDNHDLPRAFTECGANEPAFDRALFALFVLRGTPCLSWGTESLAEGAGEPANRADLNWAQAERRKTTIAKLQAARRTHPALFAGDTRILALGSDHLLLARSADAQTALIAFTFGPGPHTISIPAPFSASNPEGVLRPGPNPTWAPAPATSNLVLDGETAWMGIYSLPLPKLDPTPAHLSIRVHTTLASGEELRLVGAGPELGAWSPERALRPKAVQSPGEAHEFVVDYPRGAVASFKLIRVGASGVTWQEGPDQTLFADSDRSITLHW